MNDMPPGSVHAWHPSGWIQSKIFSQWFLHFIKHTKLTKEDPVILVLDRHYSHTRNLEVITLAQENHDDIICLPPHSSHEMQPLDKAFMGPLKTFYCQEIEKWLCSHPGPVINIYQVGELFGNAYKRAATVEIAANGFWATGLSPCDKNIFRPYDFPLSSEDTDAAPMNHPALVKTSISHHSCLLIFCCSLLLRLSSLQITSLNLKPNPCGGIAKKIMSSPYKIFVEATQKKKIKQATKPKPVGLRQMLFLVLQIDGREGFVGIQLLLTLHQIQTLT